MKNVKNNKGITLMALVITIILLIILASIGIYSGRQVVKSAQFTAFSSELKIMQTQVNSLYEKKKNNEKILLNNVETEIEDIGTAISSISLKDQEKANMAFIASGITDSTDYKYFDTDTIKSLNIEGVEGEFLVNIDKRSVVSYDGFEYEGKTYYTLEQLPDGLYNVEHNTSEEQPDFDVDYEILENGKCKISVNNINYNGNINKWQVKYKKEEDNDWYQANNYSFVINELGNYRVKIANNNTESREKQIMAKGLPSEFQEVEYIESTGTQYIITNITLSRSNIINIIWMQTNIKTNENQFIFGARTSARENNVEFYKNNLEKINLDYGDYANNRIPIETITLNKWYETRITKELIVQNEIAYNVANTNDFLTPPIYIFFANNIYSGSPMQGRIKKFEIEDVANFIPCYSTTTVTDADGKQVIANKNGMYDLVEGKFYTNQGTGDFDRGKDIDSGETIKQIIINNM